MISKNRTSPRGFRVLASLFFIIGIASASSKSANNTTIVRAKPSEDGASLLPMEARNSEVLIDAPSTKPLTKIVGPTTRNGDSYLEALKHSRTSTDPREGIVPSSGQTPIKSGSFQRRKEGPVFVASSRVQNEPDRDGYSMVPSDSYTLPSRTSSPRITYGPPVQQPPRPVYGPAFNDYPSSDHGSYLPPHQAYGPPASAPAPAPVYVPYGAPESVHLGLPSIDFSLPFSLKLNAFTLAKIILKLVIFKMIVKFIAVICLLLFIPKLEIKKNKGGMQNDDDDEEDEGRALSNTNWRVRDRLNTLTLAVNEAMRQHGVDCATLECRIGRAFEREKSWPDYEQLLQSYLLEETRIARMNI
ncbi:uncharacterized protein LOC108630568 isoform X2 [Ceratina calcarata]|uniref:Uncharacterized protein LOC108630568 isoform X2 n=1 Tax=Ceratina calcarata TaxID=156304 RepID=A0AAJ7SAU7_9HYME|nr:uncharacterized protein LOC108630568 isoform X2 [Ceratina calcarata]